MALYNKYECKTLDDVIKIDEDINNTRKRSRRFVEALIKTKHQR